MDATPLFPIEQFRRYRRHCKEHGYCEPWHPYGGRNYGRDALPKFLNLGGAAWWSDGNTHPCDDQEALNMSKQATYRFVEDGAYFSPFWHLLRRVSKDVFGVSDWNAFLASVAWSNLTKTSLVGETAPPNNDGSLIELDCQLLRHELAVLQPDFVLCVSGSIMPSVGYKLFDRLPECLNSTPATESTWFRSFPNGSRLMWTMHPAYKSADWFDKVIDDLRTLVRP